VGCRCTLWEDGGGEGEVCGCKAVWVVFDSRAVWVGFDGGAVWVLRFVRGAILGFYEGFEG